MVWKMRARRKTMGEIIVFVMVLLLGDERGSRRSCGECDVDEWEEGIAGGQFG
jgi:hypothetical protein